MFALWKLILDHVEELYGIMDLTKTARDVKNSFMEVSINMSISIPLFIDRRFISYSGLFSKHRS